MSGEKATNRGANGTILAMVGVTAVYLVILALLISRIKPCEDVVMSTWRLLRPFDRYFQCRDINELGDALAGAFAPLAFLWLAGAVFIQSRELAAQRQELEETRVVMREQAAESRATKEYVGRQTEMLSAQETLRAAEQADEAFDETVRALGSDLGTNSPRVRFLRSQPEADARFHEIVYNITPANGIDVQSPGTSFSQMLSVVRAVERQLAGHADDKSARLTSANIAGIQQVRLRLAELAAIVPRLSEAHRVRASHLEIATLAQELSVLQSRIEEVVFAEVKPQKPE